MAVALRSLRLDFQPLWWDEGYSIWFAHLPLGEMLRRTAEDIHPPLYYALLGGWSQLFGLAPAALRLFSVGVGVLAVGLMFGVGASLGGRRAGWLAAFLLAISPLYVFYSQEVRMYALVALWSLLATGLAAAWLGLTRSRRLAGHSPWMLAGYVAAVVLALYTQYYAGFLAVGLAAAGLWVLWRRRAPWRRGAAWLVAQASALLLYLPWLRFAAPRLAPYVSQKVVADSDRPLGLIEYLARHLSAYAAGHLEGPLASWWWLGVLGLAPLLWGMARLVRTPASQRQARLALAVQFLGIALAIILGLGWLVNTGFPFFPERGERLLLLGLPLFLLLLALVVAGDYRLEAASQGQAGEAQRRRESLAVASLYALLAGVSLAAFYTTPRYAGEDYRPLIGQVQQWGRPEDTVLAVFPWQAGYFLSYGSRDGPQPALLSGDDWSDALRQEIDAALARGHLWFPEHLSLGGILESRIEQHLGEDAYLLANRWYSPSTRLTGWAAAPALPASNHDAAGSSVGSGAVGPITFSDGLALTTLRFGPAQLAARNDALLIDLAYAAPADSQPRYLHLRLAGADGRTWAQQDYLLAQPDAMRVGLLAPSATPPGRYDLLLSLLHEPNAAPLSVVDSSSPPAGNEVSLGQVEIVAPSSSLSIATLPLERRLSAAFDDAVQLLGFSATSGPLLPGEDLGVNLFWQALPGLSTAGASDLFAFVQLLDEDGQLVAGWEGPPVAWHPTSRWQPGELVRSQHSLRLPATLAPGRYQLIAGLFDPASDQRLRARPLTGLKSGRLGRARDFIALGQVEVAGREHLMTAPQPPIAWQAELARLGRLLGYDLPTTSLAPGQPLGLTLYWQATDTTGERLKVFVHLLDAAGNIIGQSDQEPAAGARPTSSWTPGEYLVDRHVLTVDPAAPAGPATLEIGLYDPLSGQRIPWSSPASEAGRDALRLPAAIAVTNP